MITRQKADSRLTVILSQMLEINHLDMNNASDASINLEIEKLDAMMNAWWVGILEYISTKEIERELAWLG
jgi:hypothetical protein